MSRNVEAQIVASVGLNHGEQQVNDAAGVIAEIVEANKAVAGISVREIVRPPRTKERLASDEVYRDFEQEALDLRNRYKVPFWMAINLVMEQRGFAVPEAVIEASALHQQTNSADIVFIPRGRVTAEHLRNLADSSMPTGMLTILSDVPTAHGEVKHIPMLDFRVSPSASATVSATRVLKNLGIPGYLLNSGNSYHFYGSISVSTEDLLTFLARSALFSPILDHRWIAHQIIERRCALRLSGTNLTRNYPYVVARVD